MNGLVKPKVLQTLRRLTWSVSQKQRYVSQGFQPLSIFLRFSLFALMFFSDFFLAFHFPAVSNPGASTAKGGPRQNVDVTSLPMWRGEKVSETRNSERERIGWCKNENTMRKRCVTKPIKKRKRIFASMISHTQVDVPNSRSQFGPQQNVLGDFRNHHFFPPTFGWFLFFSRKRLVTFKPRSPWVERDRFSCDIVGHFGYGMPRGCLGHLEICIAIGHVLQHEARGC